MLRVLMMAVVLHWAVPSSPLTEGRTAACASTCMCSSACLDPASEGAETEMGCSGRVSLRQLRFVLRVYDVTSLRQGPFSTLERGLR
jgi:hypothetical protein